MSSKRRIDDDYEQIERIGEGSYGSVYKVRNRATKDIVALKRVKLNRNTNGHTYDEGVPSSSLREIAALKNLKHPNILQLLEIVHTGSSIYLVFEHLDKDLKKALEETQNGFSEKLVKSYMLQLFKGISYCHARRILHRDLKLQNLLVNQEGSIKLADFGLARNISLPSRLYTKEVVTLWYRAPELLLGSDYYGPPIDCWSLGCIFYELSTKKVLFPGDSAIGQLFKIFKLLGTPNDKTWPDISSLAYYKAKFPKWPGEDMKKMTTFEGDAADLLAKLLVYDPFKRLSAQNAFKHPYFNEINRRLTLRDIQDHVKR